MKKLPLTSPAHPQFRSVSASVANPTVDGAERDEAVEAPAAVADVDVVPVMTQRDW